MIKGPLETESEEEDDPQWDDIEPGKTHVFKEPQRLLPPSQPLNQIQVQQDNT